MATTTKKQEEPAKLIYELSLHGVVNQSSYAQLLTRLDGICGTIVHQHPSLRFKTWETVHITQRTMPQNPSAMVARPPKETIEFRLIHEYDKDQDCWKCKHMKYFGRIAPSTKEKTYKTCTRQVSYGHAFSENVIPFLNAIKCELNYEFVKKGIRFMTRNNIQIEIFQLYRMETQHAPTDDKIVSVDESNYMIQLSCEASYEEIPFVEGNMITIADNLASIVTLYKDVPMMNKAR